MVSCESMNNPGTGSTFDPLQTPGSQFANQGMAQQQTIRPGQFVVAAMDNTAFYNQRPGPEAQADQLLDSGTSMRVISTSGSFFRVELDSGEVGFVPRVMIQDPSADPDVADSEFGIYPAGDIPQPDVDHDTDGSTPPLIEPVPDPDLDSEHVPLPDI